MNKFEMDKKKLGSFIAELRKEKGLTQKELAEKLFLSDKAISKWETGVSIPDTIMLIPLADLLGVTVTELLTYEKITPKATLDAEKVEGILKATITYSEEEQLKNNLNKKQWTLTYIVCLIFSALELLYCYINDYWSENLLIFIGLCAFFGGYFCIFARTKLPTYYDENRINLYSDGIFRMNVPGVAFHNTNWPHILHALRVWATISMVLYPVLHVLIMLFLPEAYIYVGGYVLLFLTLTGMFVPVYVLGKKYE